MLATQNPIEMEGTYPLPEAQLDRFLFKVEIHRNAVDVLMKIVQNREIGVEPEVQAVLTPEEFRGCMDLARRIYLPDVVAQFIARLVHATHPGESKAAEGVSFGASPRAALALAAAAKSRALLHQRLNASFEDVQAIARPVLQHRLVLDYRAKVAGRSAADVVGALLEELRPAAADLPKHPARGQDFLSMSAFVMMKRAMVRYGGRLVAVLLVAASSPMSFWLCADARDRDGRGLRHQNSPQPAVPIISPIGIYSGAGEDRERAE